jgi:hypothetical protein
MDKKYIILIIFVIFIVGYSIESTLNSHGGHTHDTEDFNISLIQSYFDKDALVGDITIEDCTLSGGTETHCYRFTTISSLSEDEIGPWCPRTIDDTNENVGIWLEGGSAYDVNGTFIKNISNFYGDENWQLYDETTGKVRYTETKEACAGAAKPDVEEEYQNHCVECLTSYLDEAPTVTYYIPVNPVFLGTPTKVSTQTGVGIAFNGIKYDAPAPTDAILSAYTVAPFDDCGGHVNLVVGYHYHAHTGCSPEIIQDETHTSLVGLALDGIGLYSIEDEISEDLDSCGGHTDNFRGYHYHISNAGKNEFIGCFSAEYGCATDGDSNSCDASKTSRPGGR